MSDFEALMNTAEAHCEELLEDGFILLAFEPCPDGSFNGWTSTGGTMTAAKAEAGLFELMHAILKNTGECSDCCHCQDRHRRVTLALEALGPYGAKPAEAK